LLLETQLVLSLVIDAKEAVLAADLTFAVCTRLNGDGCAYDFCSALLFGAFGLILYGSNFGDYRCLQVIPTRDKSHGFTSF
jgi:hypothetical protein